MTIRECYEKMGSDYYAVLERIPSEAIITKFAKKFIDDASYSNLENAMTQNNAEEAFREVHTLKGICLNLGFDTLYKASFELTEKLRDGHIDGSKEAYEAVKAAYGLTVNAIKELDV